MLGCQLHSPDLANQISKTRSRSSQELEAEAKLQRQKGSSARDSATAHQVPAPSGHMSCDAVRERTSQMHCQTKCFVHLTACAGLLINSSTLSLSNCDVLRERWHWCSGASFLALAQCADLVQSVNVLNTAAMGVPMRSTLPWHGLSKTVCNCTHSAILEFSMP